MEESEKRSERLKAMRMDAARTGVNEDSQSLGLPSSGLSNPLIEGEAASSIPEQYSSPRFNFYTDPLSGFSGNKGRNTFSPRVVQGYHCTPPRRNYLGTVPSPTYQNPGFGSPDHSTFQSPRLHYDQSSSHGSTFGVSSPFGRPQDSRPNYPGMVPSPIYQDQGFRSPGHSVFQSPRLHYDQSSPHGSTVGVCSPLDRPQDSSPWGQFGGNNFPDNSIGTSFTNVVHERGDSPYYFHGPDRGGISNTHSRGYRYDRGNHYYPNSGRGRGQLNSRNFSQGSRSSGRRGTGSHDYISAELRPDLYYRKEMAEDPWKSMTPIILKRLDSGKSWLPKSLSVKKTKTSSETSIKSISQPSLAAYLAASFSETVDDTDS